MAVKTGQEIVTELFDKLNSTNISTESRETLLEDLEYHLHQVCFIVIHNISLSYCITDFL